MTDDLKDRLWTNLLACPHPTVQSVLTRLDREVSELKRQHGRRWSDTPEASRLLGALATAAWDMPNGWEAWSAGVFMAMAPAERPTLLTHLPPAFADHLRPWLPRLNGDEADGQLSFLRWMHETYGCGVMLPVYMGIAHVAIHLRHDAQQVLVLKRVTLHPLTTGLLDRIEQLAQLRTTPSRDIPRLHEAVAAVGTAGRAWAAAGGPDRDCPIPHVATSLGRIWARMTSNQVAEA